MSFLPNIKYSSGNNFFTDDLKDIKGKKFIHIFMFTKTSDTIMLEADNYNINGGVINTYAALITHQGLPASDNTNFAFMYNICFKKKFLNLGQEITLNSYNIESRIKYYVGAFMYGFTTYMFILVIMAAGGSLPSSFLIFTILFYVIFIFLYTLIRGNNYNNNEYGIKKKMQIISKRLSDDDKNKISNMINSFFDIVGENEKYDFFIFNNKVYVKYDLFNFENTPFLQFSILQTKYSNLDKYISYYLGNKAIIELSNNFIGNQYNNES